jgi:hypothetical protein
MIDYGSVEIILDEQEVTAESADELEERDCVFDMLSNIDFESIWEKCFFKMGSINEI